MTKVIVITSGKGGVGKTNISVNTAVELATRGYNCCLFDADLGLANANILLGIHPEKTLDDFVFKDDELQDVIHHTTYGFDIIAGSSGVEEMANLNGHQVAKLTTSFSQLEGYDYFLIDTSSGISKSVTAFCLAADETVLTITSESTSLTDAYALLKLLDVHKYKGAVKIVVNKCTNIPKSREIYRHFKSVADNHLSIQIAPLGAILFDPNIEKSVIRQQPVITLFPDTIGSQCIRALVNNLTAIDNNTREDKGFGTFWHDYFSTLYPAQTTQPITAPGDTSITSDDNSDSDKTTAKPIVSQETAQALSHMTQPALLRLSSPPQIYHHILSMYRTNQLSSEEMKKIISADPALTVNLLLLLSTKPGNLHLNVNTNQAIDTLGYKTVSNWLLHETIQAALASDEPNIPFLVQFWHHSYTSALLAHSLASSVGYPNVDEIYLAALLHNIGRLITQSIVPELYLDFSELPVEPPDLLTAENNYFSRDHAEIGADILKDYGFNSYIVDAARYHTFSIDEITTALLPTKLVYLAHHLLSTSSEEMDQATAVGLSLTGIIADTQLQLKEEATEHAGKKASRLGIKDFSSSAANNTYGFESAQLKKLAADFIMMQSALATMSTTRYASGTQKARATDELEDVFSPVYRGLQFLFNLKDTLCFVADDEKQRLSVAGQPQSLSGISSGEVEIPYTYDKSIVMRVFRSGKLEMVSAAELELLADQQFLHLLSADQLLCLPLQTCSSMVGVILVGISESCVPRIDSLRESLQFFVNQAATNITLS